MRAPRVLLVSLLAAAALAGVLTVALAPGHDAVRREPERSAPTRAGSATTRALRVLAEWDRRRAAAWRHGDPAALEGLYVPGSAAGRRDRRMLAAYRARGLRVGSMHRQVVAARVSVSRRRRISVVVTDRLVDALVVGPQVRAALPSGRLRTRRITVRRLGGAWRVASVAPVAERQPAR